MRTLLIALLGLILFVPRQANAEEPTKPVGLKPGDKIMIVAPAGPLTEASVRLAAKRLEGMGFNVVVPSDVFRRRGYLAGTDQARADELMQAFQDPSVDAIFPGRGGYGTARMLDLLDWDVIRENPKVVIGFSDITALHIALNTKANLVTFHSPNPQWGLGSEDNLPDFSSEYLWRNLLAARNGPEQIGFTYSSTSTNPKEKISPLKKVHTGVAEGRLIGGNLSLVASLTGTPYMGSTKGRVLFLEDINEAPYRIDRMLRQLKLAGHLDQCAAVILGQFTKCEGDADSLTLKQVFDDYFAQADYPVVCGFPAGHTEINATLPMNCLVRVDAERLQVTVLENPVATD